jgi:NAD+ synthase (glutamine-hydrolysing)
MQDDPGPERAGIFSKNTRMKIALAQLNYHVGDLSGNASRMKSTIAEAKKRGADLVVFPELAICGYPPKDLLEFSSFVNSCEQHIREIAGECRGIAAVAGSPSRNPGKGKSLFNSAFFMYEGEVQAVVHKGLLPTYDVFDEYRYFEPDESSKIIEYKGFRIALTICEDLWNLGDHLLYQMCPMDRLSKEAPDLMLNIAASPFSYEQQEQRHRILSENVARYGLPLLYVNHVGAHTDLIFDGGSLVMDASGRLVGKLGSFREDLRIYTVEKGAVMPAEGESAAAPHTPSRIESIHDALVLGIRDYFAKMGFTKAILGLSGGIDSAVVLYLAVQALGAEQVKAVLLPSQFSSDHSVSDAVQLARTLQVSYDTIPIKGMYDRAESSLEPFFRGLPFSLAEENLQARIRGLLLMALSNKFGYILLNTTNKSEMAVGYGTLYGDMCGGISVLGDVYKTDVYALAAYINRERELIPAGILTKAPSAELRPGQKDADSLPEYNVLDRVLYQYIEESRSTEEIVGMGFDRELVTRVTRMVNSNEYKRYQAAPVLRVSPKSFGSGRRMPIVAKYPV